MAGGITNTELFSPIKNKSLKDDIISKFENLIFGGELKAGDKLPPERELARAMSVGRPIIHESLVELNAKGLVKIIPRKGAYVADLKTDGTIAALAGILNHQTSSGLPPKVLYDLLQFRKSLEPTGAALAAKYRDEESLSGILKILEKEKSGAETAEECASLDYQFHHAICSASGNIIYSLLINSFRDLYMRILEKFYHEYSGTGEIFKTHAKLYQAIKDKDEEAAKTLMLHTAELGEKILKYE